MRLCDLSLCLYLKILEQHAERATPLQLNTPQDVRAMASSIEVVLKTRELLEGNATARTSSMTLDEVKANLEAALAERDALLSTEQLDSEIEALTKRRADKLKAGGETVH